MTKPGLKSFLLSLVFGTAVIVAGAAFAATTTVPNNRAALNHPAAHFLVKTAEDSKIKRVCKWVEERIKNAAGKFEVRRTQVCMAVRG